MNTGISKGKIKQPDLILIYAPDGCGKSTFGSEAPNPIFLGPEAGSGNLDVARFDNVKTFSDVRANIKRLINEDLGFETLVIDSLDWCEPLLYKEICEEQKKDTIEECFGSYGKWVSGVNSIWLDFIKDLNTLREKRKMNMIFIAHAQVKKFDDPTTPLPYDRYQLKLAEKTAALWREYVDVVLFANFEVVTKQINKTDKKTKAYGEDVRLMYTQRRPSFDAKNRFGLPFQMPLGYSYYKAAMTTGPSLDQVMLDLNEQMANPKMIPHLERMKVAIDKANGDVTQLLKISNYATTLITAGE